MSNISRFMESLCVAGVMCIGQACYAKNDIPAEVILVGNKFIAALQKGNVDELSENIQYPIRSNEFGTIKNQEVLKKIFLHIFPKERICGLKGRLPEHTPDGNYALSSSDEGDPVRFLFKKVGVSYKMYCIDNINE